MDGPEGADPNRRYSIGEASEMTGVPVHLLRQWETRYPQLRPHRTKTNRRFFFAKDIEIILRIKTLTRHEGMTGKGAKMRLTEELRGAVRPRTQGQARILVDKIIEEARTVLNILGPDTEPMPAQHAPSPPPENIERFKPGRG